MKRFLLLILLMVALTATVANGAADEGKVLVVTISSDIATPTVELVERSILEAETGSARLIVYELNTPGGDLGSVTAIMNDFNKSPIPIVVWVAPKGSAAWSGGTYLLMAAHIAAMASGTTIGSAQPVTAAGQVLNQSKYINALSGLMRDNARLHDRNQTLAVEFITKNINLGPEEALKYHVIELVADNLQGLLSQLEPYTLVLAAGEGGTSSWRIVRTDSMQGLKFSESFSFSGITTATTYNYQPSFSVQILQFLANPIITWILLLVGLYAVVTGFKAPGFGIEIAGGLMVLLALIGFGIIGMSIAPILLFLIGAILTIVEIKTHIGVFAIAGIALIVLGSFLYFPPPGWELLAAQSVQSGRETLISVSLVMSGIFGFFVYKIAQARRLRPQSGPDQLIGKSAVVVRALVPRGEVRVEGQIWRAEVLGTEAREGEEVQVVGREGLLLRVKSKQSNV